MIQRAKTLTELWETSCERMFFGESPEISKGSSMTMSFGNLVTCRSMEYKMDVGLDLNLTKSRFPALQRDYIDGEEYAAFLGRCENVAKKKGSTTQMMARVVKPRGINSFKKTGNKAHGGCILGFTFRMGKRGQAPAFGMHSRVSYLSYMGALDLALAYCIAREVGALIGFGIDEAAFTWYCDSFQWASMQSVALVSARDALMEAIDDPGQFPDGTYPTIALMRKTIVMFDRKMQEGFTPQEEKYAQLMRYRTRYERTVRGDPLPSIPVETLNLSAIRRP